MRTMMRRRPFHRRRLIRPGQHRHAAERAFYPHICKQLLTATRSSVGNETNNEADALQALIDEDERALWDERGNMVNGNTGRVIWEYPPDA